MVNRFGEQKHPFLFLHASSLSGPTPTKIDLLTEILMLSKSYKECVIASDRILTGTSRNFRKSFQSNSIDLRDLSRNLETIHKDYLQSMLDTAWLPPSSYFNPEQLFELYKWYDLLTPYSVWLFAVIIVIFYFVILIIVIYLIVSVFWLFKS